MTTLELLCIRSYLSYVRKCKNDYFSYIENFWVKWLWLYNLKMAVKKYILRNIRSYEIWRVFPWHVSLNLLCVPSFKEKLLHLLQSRFCEHQRMSRFRYTQVTSVGSSVSNAFLWFPYWLNYEHMSIYGKQGHLLKIANIIYEKL